MENNPRNHRRGNRPLEVRMDLEFKTRVQMAAMRAGTDASKLTKQLLAWYLGEAELPPRPQDA